MINYFYNICSKEDTLNFYTDVLTNIRKDFYLSKEKIKGKITQNSSLNSVFYEYSIEQNKPIKWKVSNDSQILSDSKVAEDGKYHVNYYDKTGLYKKLTFSKLHTLLKIEYYNMDKSSVPYCVIEPRKSNNGLCLLVNIVGSYQSVILFAMPDVEDDYVCDRVEAEFTDYCAVASTNEGVVKFLDSTQIEKFNDFVAKATNDKELVFKPESYIDEADAVLAKTLNPKDFNIKKNLSQAIDLTQALEFSFEEDDGFDELIAVSDDVEEQLGELFEDQLEEQLNDVDLVSEVCDNEIVDDTDDDHEESEVYVSSFKEYTIDDIENHDNIEIDNMNTPSVEYTENIAEAEENSEIIDDADIGSVVNEEVVDSSFVEIVDTAVTDINAERNEYKPLDQTLASTDIEDKTSCSPVIEVEQADVQIEVVEQISDAESDNEFIVCHTSDPDRVVESANAKYLYFGQLDEMGNRHGFGRTATENGRTAYEGYYSANKRNGIGSYYYKDGQLCYYGNWKNNKREGFGIGVSSVDQSVHVGAFENNKPCGDGVRVDSDGNIQFVSKTLSDGVSVTLKFDGDKIIVIKQNKDGEIISENSSNLKYF